MGRYKNAVVSTYLKTYRKRKELGQKQMADILETCREHYSRIEEGKIYPGKGLLHRINNLVQPKCKPASQLEMCNLCVQLKEEDKAAIILKMMKVIKSYNRIQPLILSLIFQLFFNLDFSNIIFLG